MSTLLLENYIKTLLKENKEFIETINTITEKFNLTHML